MRVIKNQAFGLHPNFLMQYRPPMSSLPSILNISGDCVVGNSGGFGQETIHGAFGEYIERFHFYNEVNINLTDKLHEANTSLDADKLLYAINQIKQTPHAAEKYAFDLTETKNIFSGEKVYVPTTLLTLSQANSLDRQYVPFIDSCGQAVHISAEKALASAFNEFVERQALISAWLSGKARSAIDMPLSHAVNEIYMRLTTHGRLIAYDLNINLPGYSVIIFYFSNSATDSVKYSVGMASDGCPRKAFLRALNELWQSYIFIYLNAEKAEHLDDRYQYLNQLLAFNNYDTENLIPFQSEDIPLVTLDRFLQQPYLSRQESLRELNTLSNAIYVYEGKINLFGRLFNYCKVFSPDFFLHMGITKPLNFKNKLAERMHIEINQEITQPIPFP